LDLSKYTIADVAFPIVLLLWATREFFRFAWNERAGSSGRRSAERESDGNLEPLSPGVARHPITRLDAYIPATIAVLFYLLCLFRLGLPSEQVFDEVHHARSAMEYVIGDVPHEWSHPPFSKEMIGLSIRAWRAEFNPRDGAWKSDEKFTEQQAVGWRFASVLFGTLTLPALYGLVRSLFQNRAMATSATILLALDGAFFVQSRIAMTNIFTVFFITAAASGLALFLREPRARWLLFTGSMLGLAIASRWSSLYAYGIIVLLLIADRIFRAIEPEPLAPVPIPRGKRQPDVPASVAPEELPGALRGWRLAAVGVLSFVVIPFVLYFATYLPNMLQGPGTVAEKLLTLNGPNQLGWYKMFTLQRDMYIYHSTLVATHPYSSPWWSWPLMLRPVWYYWHSAGPGMVSGIWCIGNAAIWWGSVPAFLTLAFLGARYEWRPSKQFSIPLGVVLGGAIGALAGGPLTGHPGAFAVCGAILGGGLAPILSWFLNEPNGSSTRDTPRARHRIGPLTIIAALGLGQWLAWGVKERALDFMHYYFECIPFACIALAYIGVRMWTAEYATESARRIGRGFVVAYATAAVAWFIFYYPLLSGFPISEWYYGQHLWLGNAWV
jgi:hypothetical protein